MRLDKYLVEHELVENRSKALNLIRENLVLVNGVLPIKPGQKISEQDSIEVKDHESFVSRSAKKLLFALNQFGIERIEGVGLDIGASTGGFSEVLLKKGVSKVYALDVGDSQLHEKLKLDCRVFDISPVNARDPFDLAEKIDVVVIDVSFISSTKILPNIIPHIKPETRIFLLFKPQFEGRRHNLNNQGVVIKKYYDQIFDTFKDKVRSLNFEIINQSDAKIIGKKGNKEKILQLQYLP